MTGGASKSTCTGGSCASCDSTSASVMARTCSVSGLMRGPRAGCARSAPPSVRTPGGSAGRAGAGTRTGWGSRPRCGLAGRSSPAPAERNTASLMECVMNRPAKPWRAKSEMTSSFSRSRVISSTAPNGSSNRNTFGSRTRLRASDARIFMPPDSCLGYLRSNPESPTSEMASAARGTRSALPTPSSSASSSTLRCTLRHCSSVAS